MSANSVIATSIVPQWLRCTNSQHGHFRSGWILIDRSGKHFGSILCYLRDGTVTLPKGRQAVQELLAEAKYYLIQGLVELCQNTLQVSHIRAVWFLKYAEKNMCECMKPSLDFLCISGWVLAGNYFYVNIMQNVSSTCQWHSPNTQNDLLCAYTCLWHQFFSISGGGVLHHHQLVLFPSGLRYMISAGVKGDTAMKTLCRKYKWTQIKIVCSLKEYYNATADLNVTTATLSHLIWGGMFTQTMVKSLTSEQSTQQW